MHSYILYRSLHHTNETKRIMSLAKITPSVKRKQLESAENVTDKISFYIISMNIRNLFFTSMSIPSPLCLDLVSFSMEFLSKVHWEVFKIYLEELLSIIGVVAGATII